MAKRVGNKKIKTHSGSLIQVPQSLLPLPSIPRKFRDLTIEMVREIFTVYVAVDRSIKRTSAICGLSKATVELLASRRGWDARLNDLDRTVEKEMNRTYESRRKEILEIADSILVGYRKQLQSGVRPKVSVAELRILQQIVLVGNGHPETNARHEFDFSSMSDAELEMEMKKISERKEKV